MANLYTSAYLPPRIQRARFPIVPYLPDSAAIFKLLAFIKFDIQVVAVQRGPPPHVSNGSTAFLPFCLNASRDCEPRQAASIAATPLIWLLSPPPLILLLRQSVSAFSTGRAAPPGREGRRAGREGRREGGREGGWKWFQLIQLPVPLRDVSGCGLEVALLI